MTTLFARFDGNRSSEVKLQEDDVTWMELSEEFFAFLQGCGYQIDRADFADYWMQYADQSDVLADWVIQPDTDITVDTNTTFTTMADTGCYTFTTTPLSTNFFGSDTITTK